MLCSTVGCLPIGVRRNPCTWMVISEYRNVLILNRKCVRLILRFDRNVERLAETIHLPDGILWPNIERLCFNLTRISKNRPVNIRVAEIFHFIDLSLVVESYNCQVNHCLPCYDGSQATNKYSWISWIEFDFRTHRTRDLVS